MTRYKKSLVDSIGCCIVTLYPCIYTWINHVFSLCFGSRQHTVSWALKLTCRIHDEISPADCLVKVFLVQHVCVDSSHVEHVVECRNRPAASTSFYRVQSSHLVECIHTNLWAIVVCHHLRFLLLVTADGNSLMHGAEDANTYLFSICTPCVCCFVQRGAAPAFVCSLFRAG